MHMLKRRASTHRYKTPAPKKISHHHMKAYWPYIPLLMASLLALVFGFGWQSPVIQKSDVLAYATNTTGEGLLQETNARRTSSGKSTLSLNSKLSQAAQAKANDMVARNYWSHNTPDGKTPWTFIDSAGYAYQKAGENLAYGFATSTDTVNGWMNSAAHKDNMLDSVYKDVGFGIANSADFQNTGAATIVVAMYGNPQVAAASTGSNTASGSKAANKSGSPAAAPAPEPITAASAANQEKVQPVTTASAGKEPRSQNIARIQLLTKGQVPWATFALGLVSGIVVAAYILKHGVALRRTLVKGERYIMHHPLFDVAVITFFAIAAFMTRGVGVIR